MTMRRFRCFALGLAVVMLRRRLRLVGFDQRGRFDRPAAADSSGSSCQLAPTCPATRTPRSRRRRRSAESSTSPSPITTTSRARSPTTRLRRSAATTASTGPTAAARSTRMRLPTRTRCTPSNTAPSGSPTSPASPPTRWRPWRSSSPGQDRMLMSPFPDLKTSHLAAGLGLSAVRRFGERSADRRSSSRRSGSIRPRPPRSQATCSQPTFITNPSTFGHPLWAPVQSS